jgi:hypothetical protein
MFYRILVLVAVLAALVACGAPGLAETNLEPLLIQPGDLPTGLSAGQVRDRAPAMFGDAPQPTKAINQKLQSSGSDAGSVTVLLYDDLADVSAAYAEVTQGFSGAAQSYEGLGEQAKTDAIAGVVGDFVFTRCHAVVHMRIIAPLDDTAAYAKRLDGRLKDVVC